MPDPATPPAAGTPPAPPAQGGNNQPPANNPAPAANQPPGNNQPPAKMHTDDEVNSIVKDRLKADREALEKELGLSGLGLQLKDVKAILKAKKDADDLAKSKEERLQQERDDAKAELSRLKLDLIKRSKVEALVANKKIKLPEETTVADILELVTGADEAGIDSSLSKLVKLFPPEKNAAQGAGTPGVSSAPAKKIWKSSEIAAMSSADHVKNKDEILLAMKENRIVEG
jgi:DNA-binding transcriptional MerR regulator